MTNRLTAVKRMDKNGRMVTRHVRVERPNFSSDRLPPPSSASPVQRRQKSLASILEYINTVTTDRWASQDMPDEVRGFGSNNWADRADALSDPVVSRLDYIFNSNDEEGMIELLMSALKNGDDNAAIDNLLTASSFDKERNAEWGSNDSRAYVHALSALYGLQCYESLGWTAPETISGAPEQDRKIAESLLNVMETAESLRQDIGSVAVYNLNAGGMKLPDGLAKLTIDNPDQGQRICDIMSDRLTADPQLIESILLSDAPAVSDGIL